MMARRHHREPVRFRPLPLSRTVSESGLKHWFDHLLEYLMATVEVPDDVAASLVAAQKALADSQRELAEAESAKLMAESAEADAVRQLMESNAAAQVANEAAAKAIADVTRYLTPKK